MQSREGVFLASIFVVTVAVVGTALSVSSSYYTSFLVCGIGTHAIQPIRCQAMANSLSGCGWDR